MYNEYRLRSDMTMMRQSRGDCQTEKKAGKAMDIIKRNCHNISGSLSH